MRTRTITAAVAVAAMGAAALYLAPSASAIVGGTTSQESYPFLVNLTLAAEGDIPALNRCGASLISDQWAVTAAHCVAAAPMDALVARVGSNDRTQGGEVRQVVKMIVHPEFDRPTEAVAVNDIALIELSAPVSAAPIALVTQAPQPGVGTRTMGWGTICEGDAPECNEKPTLLQQLDTAVTEPAACSAINKGKNQELCIGEAASGAGACNGDSGGPLVVAAGYGRWELAGIVSRNGAGSYICGENPVIYTSTAAYAQWITDNLPAHG